ncbi:hypothetical protein MJO28_016086 [Puccinia striiformis f. sp. tritici]|uniref:Secreted protein n=2 Tax=Puccinia striiformis f. sp. tritici TaxID=168172 RepID=A0A0L0UYD9_9BASI|nr:hypothetical protein Pst134EB_029597 [Puccinia striiformis f. sp. tritici]KAI7936003.1 hypothetical protein MJO29_015306 [Puccinia striiformis f. sp. tritici]KAI7937187.1 hypothetical protein MJO28_016086 [Puccinia striiformis f. sp. tritici]KNE91941.1 hypothetical protein PSTG_14654 [Puccinia striiformis f. sp. tritici PST-78]
MQCVLFWVSICLLGLVTISTSSPYPPPVSGPKTMKCTRYSNLQGPNTTCNDDPNEVCTGGCTGAVVASECKKEGDSSVQSAQVMCTISYSQPSLDHGVCVNDQGTFTCQGIPQGEATCTGCSSVASEPVVSGPQITNTSHPDSHLPGETTNLSLSTAAPATRNLRQTIASLFVFSGIGIIKLIL